MFVQHVYWWIIITVRQQELSHVEELLKNDIKHGDIMCKNILYIGSIGLTHHNTFKLDIELGSKEVTMTGHPPLMRPFSIGAFGQGQKHVLV